MRLENLVSFGRALREHGLSATPAEVVTAATVLQHIDTTDRDEVFLSLRTVLTTSVDDFPIFAEIFEKFWTTSPRARAPKQVDRESTAHTSLRTRSLAQTRGLAFFLENWNTSARADARPIDVPCASDDESRAQKDFTEFTHDELEEISRLARRIVKRLSNRPSRRWQPTRRGHRVNLRRSLRLSLKTGGELIDLSYRRRRRKRTKLVVICDVSGSMDMYSRLLLQFIYGLQNSFAKVESFVFATSLSRITGDCV